MRKLLRFIAVLLIPTLILSGNGLLSYAFTVEGLDAPDGEHWQQVNWPGQNGEPDLLINLFNGVNVTFGEGDLANEEDPDTHQRTEKNYIFLNGSTGTGDFTDLDNASIYADSSSSLTDTVISQGKFTFDLSGNTSYATIVQDVSGAENLNIANLFALAGNEQTSAHVYGMGVAYSALQAYENYWPEQNEKMIEICYDNAGVSVTLNTTHVEGDVLIHPEGWGKKAKLDNTGTVAVTFQIDEDWEFDGLKLDNDEYDIDDLTDANFSDDRISSMNLQTGTVTFVVQSDYMNVEVRAHDPNGGPGPQLDSKYSVSYDHRPEENNPTAYVWAGSATNDPLSWQGTRYDFTTGTAITFILQKPSDNNFANETPVVELRETMDDYSEHFLSTGAQNNEDKITLTQDANNALRYSFTYTPGEHVGEFEVRVYWSEYDRVNPSDTQVCIEANLERTAIELLEASANPTVVTRSNGGQAKYIYPVADKTKYLLFSPDQGYELTEVRINNTSYDIDNLTAGTATGTYKIQLTADMYDDARFLRLEARSFEINNGGGNQNDPNDQNQPGPNIPAANVARKAFDYAGAKASIESEGYAFSFNDANTVKDYLAKQIWTLEFGFLPRKGHSAEYEGMFGHTLTSGEAVSFNYDTSDSSRNPDDRLIFVLSSDVGTVPHARIYLSDANGYQNVTTIGQTDMGFIDAEVGLISGTEGKYAFSFSPKSAKPFDVRIYWTDTDFEAIGVVDSYTPASTADNNCKVIFGAAPSEKNVSVNVSSYLTGMDELKSNLTVTGPVTDTTVPYENGYLDCYNFSLTLPDNSVATGKVFKLTQLYQGIVRLTKNNVDSYKVFDIPAPVPGTVTDINLKGDHDPGGMYVFGNGVGVEGPITNGFHMGQGATDMAEDPTIGGLSYRLSIFQASSQAIKVEAAKTAAAWDFGNTSVYEVNGVTEYHAEAFYGNDSITIRAADFGDGVTIESVSVDTEKLAATAATIVENPVGVFTITFNSGYDSIPLLIKFTGDDTVYKETIDRLGINADWEELGKMQGYNGLNIWHGTDHIVYYDATCFDNKEAAVFATFYYDSDTEPTKRLNIQAKITLKDGTIINKLITESITSQGLVCANGDPGIPNPGAALQGNAQYYDDFVIYTCSRAEMNNIASITFFAYEKSNDPNKFEGAKIGSGDGYRWTTGL